SSAPAAVALWASPENAFMTSGMPPRRSLMLAVRSSAIWVQSLCMLPKSPLSAPVAEEITQEAGALLLAQAAVNVRRVVARGLGEQAGAVLDAAALRIIRAKVHPAHPKQRNGSRAHG